MTELNTRRIAVVLLAVLIVLAPIGVAAYTVVFDAGAGGTWEVESGLEVTTGVQHGMSDQNPALDNNTLYITEVTFSSSADTAVTVDQFTGTETQLSAIDASNGTITVDPDDKSAVEIDGAVTDLSWGDAALDGSNQITYSASGSGTITATGLSADTDFVAATPSGDIITEGSTTSDGEASISVDSATDEDVVLLEPSAPELSNGEPDSTTTHYEDETLSIDVSDAGFGTTSGDEVTLEWSVDGDVRETTTSTGNGTETADVGPLEDGTHNWSVTATDSYNETTTSDTYSWTIEHDAPALSNATPEDGADLTERDQTFEINVDDADFSRDGDSVNASLYVDDEYVGSDTVTENGTASVSTTISEGGEHEYYWIAEDEYDESTTSNTNSFQVPAELELRQETDPETLVTDATANITAYYGDEVMTSNTSDGTLNLTNFPVDQPLVVRVQADGYTTRTAIIESIYEQSNMYLLNDTEDHYKVRYELSDPAGKYPAEDTVLFVERDITLKESTDWRVISGDNIGIQGVPVDLVEDERYRLRLKNLETGETTVLGSYTAVQSETVTLSPKSPEIDITDSEKVYDWSLTTNDDGDALVFEYLDTEDETSSLKLTIHERYNKSNVLVDNESFSSNELLYETPMNDTQQNTTWMAEIYIDRGDGYTQYRESVGGGIADIVPSNLDTVWTTSISVFIMLVAGMAFSMLHVGVGAIATSAIGGILWYLGLLANVATAPSIALAMTVSVLYHYRQGGGF